MYTRPSFALAAAAALFLVSETAMAEFVSPEARGCSCGNVKYEFTINPNIDPDEECEDKVDRPDIDGGMTSCTVSDSDNPRADGSDGYFINGVEQISFTCGLSVPEVGGTTDLSLIPFNYTSGTGEVIGEANQCIDDDYYNIKFNIWVTVNGVTKLNTIGIYYWDSCENFPGLVGLRIGWFTFTNVSPVIPDCPYPANPTAMPSGVPSDQPSISVAPSGSTDAPTFKPTNLPTTTPLTDAPTAKPTNTPSFPPTLSQPNPLSRKSSKKGKGSKKGGVSSARGKGV